MNIQVTKEQFAEIVQDARVIVIRPGRIPFPLGTVHILNTHDGSMVPVKILRISHCRVRHTPMIDCIVYDRTASNPDELLPKLREDFLQLTEDSHITIVRFDRNGEVGDIG